MLSVLHAADKSNHFELVCLLLLLLLLFKTQSTDFKESEDSTTRRFVQGSCDIVSKENTQDNT